MFGVVDINFYYYYKKYVQNESDILDKMYSYTKNYIELIDSLPVKQKYILGILPSHIKTEDFKSTLKKYIRDDMSDEQINMIPDEDIDIKMRNIRVKNMNNLITKYCDEKNNVNFCNIYDYITDNDELKSIFHLKHNKYLLVVYLNKYMKFLLKYYDYDMLLKRMEKNFNKYFKRTCKKNNVMYLYEKNKFNIKMINDYVKKI